MVCTGLALLPFLWTRLLPYQKMRLVVFFNPELDPLGYGYQLKQSMIAIGSGGVTGKGIYQGTQAGLRFLPEPYTDFIFSVLGEELGFLGAVFLLFLYFLLIYHILKIGSYSKDTFGAYICIGVAAHAGISDTGEHRYDFKHYAGYRNTASFYELRRQCHGRKYALHWDRTQCRHAAA